jgi:hypothetical protein
MVLYRKLYRITQAVASDFRAAKALGLTTTLNCLLPRGTTHGARYPRTPLRHFALSLRYLPVQDIANLTS